MPHLCLDCFNTYRSDLMRKAEVINNYDGSAWTFCPNTKCNGNVIEVDELMLPTIKLLNQKGYHTKYCCSGHIYEQVVSCYIMFEEGIDVCTLPSEFIKDLSGVDNNNVCIESSLCFDAGFDEYTAFNFILDANKELLDWAKKLPKLN